MLAIANVVDSVDPARCADASFYTHAGPEIGVASTKAFTTQLAALAAARDLPRPAHAARSTHERARGAASPSSCPAPAEDARRGRGWRRSSRCIARRYGHARDFLFLGRGTQLPDRARGRAQAEGDLVHPRRGLRRGRDEARADRAHRRAHAGRRARAEGAALREGRCRTCRRSSAREGKVIAVATRGDHEIGAIADDVHPRSPTRAPELQPLLTVLPLQLLAYYVADFKGTDVDQPRNLAKTVTVE